MSVNIQSVLLGMREYRMGLIQTPNQLRFSYMAVIEGAKLILTDNSTTQVAESQGWELGQLVQGFNAHFLTAVNLFAV